MKYITLTRLTCIDLAIALILSLLSTFLEKQIVFGQLKADFDPMLTCSSRKSTHEIL